MPWSSLARKDRHVCVLPGNEENRMVKMPMESRSPPLPKPDEEGNVPALEYVRASIARDGLETRD